MVLSISTFIAKGEIEVSLPKSETAGTPAQPQPTLVQIDEEGVLHWAGEAVDWTALDGRIAALSRDERIVLRIDKDSRFDHFIRVIDLLKKHRHENFAIAAEKEGA